MNILDAAGIKYGVQENTDDYGGDDGTLGGTLIFIRGAGFEDLLTHWHFHKDDGRLLFVTNTEGNDGGIGLDEKIGIALVE